MDLPSPALLLQIALCAYAVGVAGSLLVLRYEKLANLVGFGCSAIAACFGIGAALLGLTAGPGDGWAAFELWPSLIPYLKLTVKLDPLSAFFLLIVSFLALALSLYSFGYVRGFYGRKCVGVLASFYNALLLATTLVFTASNAFFFLLAWEIMALTAYCLVSFEHEKAETRNAGVLYFIMSHVGTGCLILGFLLLFQAAGGSIQWRRPRPCAGSPVCQPGRVHPQFSRNRGWCGPKSSQSTFSQRTAPATAGPFPGSRC